MNRKIYLLTQWTDITVVNINICKYCSEDFPLYDLEKQILDTQGFSYPDFCPTCRFRMLYSYINDKHLYHRKDDFSWSQIVSSITPEFEGVVYKAEDYKKMILDDFWLDYGMDIGGDIFEDFKTLRRDFPRSSKLIYPKLENVEYASHLWWAKNVYMSFCVFYSENVYFSLNILFECRNVFSSYDVTKSTNIYQSGLVNASYEIAYSYNILDSSFLIFCRNMQNCQNCIFSCNQVGKQYMIYNKQYTKEKYEQMKAIMLTKMNQKNGVKLLEEEYENFLEKNLIETAQIIVNSDGVIGERIYNSKNSINVYISPNTLEESVNALETGGGKRLINSVASWFESENIIWCCSAWIQSSWLYFCHSTVENCHNIYYSSDMESCEECMYCIGLKGKKYCILNRQYEKEKYFELKVKIIADQKQRDHWWEYLWFDFSPFPYNDTLAYDYFKVNRVLYADGTLETVDPDATWIVRVFEDTYISDAELDLGWAVRIPITWRTRSKEVNIPEWVSTIHAWDLDIITKDEDIFEKAILCEESHRPFKIIRSELEFVRQRWFPLPKIHPELRIDRLVSLRPLWQFFVWRSDLSWEEFLTIFRKKPKFKVYSPEEYRKSMYS